MTAHPFETLRPEYDRLLATMTITRGAEAEETARRLIANKARYAAVSAKAGIPAVWIAASFEREASSNFALSPAQGDPWNRVSTHVPRGRGPFTSWIAAALDAYHIDHMDAVGAANWTPARNCYELEIFNGFGYRAHGIHSPYLWAGTNLYTTGKYVADGVWRSDVADKQLGCIPIVSKMIALDPSLAIAGWPGASTTVLPVVPAPSIVPVGLGFPEPEDTDLMQRGLNLIGADPQLVVDGSFGRRTRSAIMAFQAAHGLPQTGLSDDPTMEALANAVAAAGAGTPPPAPTQAPPAAVATHPQGSWLSTLFHHLTFQG